MGAALIRLVNYCSVWWPARFWESYHITRAFPGGE